MILVTARIEVPPPSRRELLQVLLQSADGVRRDRQALSAHVYEDLESPTVLCLESSWRSREALAAHMNSQRFGSLLGAVEVLASRTEVAMLEVPEEAARSSLTLRALRDTLRGGPRADVEPGINEGEHHS